MTAVEWRKRSMNDDFTRQLDDQAKLDWLWRIKSRYFVAIQKAWAGLNDQAVIDELAEVCAEFEELRRIGLPAFVDLNEIGDKIADSKNTMAYVCGLIGRAEQAKRYYEDAARAYEAIGKKESADSCRSHILSAERREEGDVDAELARLRQTLDAVPKDSLQNVETLVELGELHLRVGDTFEARRLLETAEEDLRRLGIELPGDDDVEAAFQRRIDEINAGQLSGGPSLHLVLAERQLLYKRLYRALAYACRKQDPTVAAEYLRKVKQIDTGGLDDEAYERKWGELAAQIGSFDQRARDNAGMFSAGEWRTQSSALSSEPETSYILIDSLSLSRELDALGMENRSRAKGAPRDDLLAWASRLEEQARQSRIPELIATALLRSAGIHLAMNQAQKAAHFSSEALRQLGNPGQADLMVQILSLLAEAQAGCQDWAAVSATCEEGIKLVELYRYKINHLDLQNAYLGPRIDLYVYGARAAYELEDIELMLRRAELSKCRYALSYTQISQAASAGLDGLEQEFRLVCEQVDAARARGEEERELLQKRRALWDLIFTERVRARTGMSLPVFSLAAVQSRIEEDEAVIYYYWIDRQTLLITTLDQRRVETELRAVSPEDWQALKNLTDFILKPKERNMTYLEREVRKLSRLLLPSAAPARLRNKRRLLISPHRMLHAFPFQSLAWEGEFLIQRFAVTYAPNLSSLLLPYSPPQTTRVLALGVSQYDVPGMAKLSPLEKTLEETQGIKDVYDQRGIHVTLLQEVEASEERLRQLDLDRELGAFTCLHFAIHGENAQSDTPMESRLFLGRSALDGLKIANWKLKADLVVLSACCSGQRPASVRDLDELPGDEMLGLQAAFFSAGARRILSSLWPVDDSVAARLMIFIHRCLADGVSPELALQSAIKEFLATADLVERKVDVWAPFFLVMMGR